MVIKYQWKYKQSLVWKKKGKGYLGFRIKNKNVYQSPVTSDTCQTWNTLKLETKEGILHINSTVILCDTKIKTMSET